MPAPGNPRFADSLRTLMGQRGVSFRQLATRAHYSSSYLHDLAAGKKPPTVEAAARLDDALDAGGALTASAFPGGDGLDDELDALELTRRVEASDVSDGTLRRLETAVDDLAMAYATRRPAELLPRVRRHLAYVARLVDARATLAQRRRLLVAGGWLSLLAATVHVDLRQHAAADARLDTAGSLAGHAEDPEISAWCLETRAWAALTDGDFPRAADLAVQAQARAPRGGSALIQATAQEGRAHARMGHAAQTRDALGRLADLTRGLAQPDRPEHHFRYDPGKALSYTATTLAWVADPAAEEYARETLRQLESSADGVARPRRVASARLDLGVALLGAGKADEAAAQALVAITSGRVVPSNWWRAAEVVAGVRRAGVADASHLAEALRVYGCPPVAD